MRLLLPLALSFAMLGAAPARADDDDDRRRPGWGLGSVLGGEDRGRPPGWRAERDDDDDDRERRRRSGRDDDDDDDD